MAVQRHDDTDMWESWIEGEPDQWGVGKPLNSSLAETLGYRVGFEDWPEWIDQWAVEIQQSS